MIWTRDDILFWDWVGFVFAWIITAIFHSPIEGVEIMYFKNHKLSAEFFAVMIVSYVVLFFCWVWVQWVMAIVLFLMSAVAVIMCLDTHDVEMARQIQESKSKLWSGVLFNTLTTSIWFWQDWGFIGCCWTFMTLNEIYQWYRNDKLIRNEPVILDNETLQVSDANFTDIK